MEQSVDLKQIEKDETNSISIKESKDVFINVEDIYLQIGGFSRFQFLVSLIILSLEIPGAMVALSPILTTSNQVDFYCEMNDSSSRIMEKEKLCDNSCNGIITSKEPFISIVQEWNLICDKAWISDTLTSVLMTGSALGSLITAHIADNYGRKTAFYSVTILMAISGICASQANSILSYGIFKFLSGLAAGGCLVAHMNYLMEFLVPSWRVICGCISLWPIGEMSLALLGFLFPDWRTLTWICVSPNFLILLTYPFLPESPRWLLCQNRTKDAENVIGIIAKCNKKPPVEHETILKLQSCIIQKNTSAAEDKMKRWTTFKNPQVLKQILIFCLAWFSNSLTYYGITFNMKNMSGNIYANVFLLGLLDWPAELLGIVLSNRFGRKSSFISCLGISVAFLIAVAILQLSLEMQDPINSLNLKKYGIQILILCLIGRFFNETSFAIMAGFTGESFPTIIRSICFSIGTIMSSLGAIIAPQMAYFGSIWAPGPYVLFCGICTISCLVSLNLEETKKKPLQDLIYFNK